MLTMCKSLISRGGNWFANLLQNCNFANGTTGWLGSSATISASNNTLSIIGNGASNGAQAINTASANINVSNKYYTRATARVTNALCGDFKLIYDGSTAGTNKVVKTQTFPTSNVWYVLSVIDTPPADATGLFRLFINHAYANATDATNAVMEVKNVICADLTALFGAGNEPTKEWCDINIAPYIKY